MLISWQLFTKKNHLEYSVKNRNIESEKRFYASINPWHVAPVTEINLMG